MFENVSKMIMAGIRYRKRKPVHHTPQVNMKTGQPHTLSREAQRRIRQQENKAWKDYAKGDVA